jgi:Thioredoxin-like domain
MTILSENEVKQKIGSEDFLLIQGASAEQLKVLEVANFVDKAVNYYVIAEGEPKITLYLKKDSRTLDYTGELTLTDLVAWTIDASSPPVVFLDSEEQTKSVFENKEKLPAFLLYRLTDFSDEALSILSAICEENKAVYRCAYVDS